MKKKYKNALVLGSFSPPHFGHLHLIDTAIKHSEYVHVFVCHRDTDEIDGEFRYESLRYLYSNNPNVKVYNVKHHHDDYPGEFGTSLDEFYELWINEVYSRIKELDVVFTSEDYGEEFADYLRVEHFNVDDLRIKYPISGTEIRKNPFDNWSEIYFNKCPKWIVDESYRRKYDLYILMDIDFEWEDDGTREFPEKRQWHFDRIKNELEKRKLNYKLASGSIEERLSFCIKEIGKL